MKNIFTLLFSSILFSGWSQSLCNNLDFENNNLGNWAVSSGTSSFSSGGTYSMSGCCATPGSSFAVVLTTPFTDPNAGTIPHSPLGGTKVVKLNDEFIGSGDVARITYTLNVTANAIFQYAIAAFVNASGHACSDAPFGNVRLRDMSSNVISYDHFVPYPSSTMTTSPCGNHSPDFTNYLPNGIGYFCWKTYTVNLTPYIGQNIMIDVTAGDCDGWGHIGYAYFDASCSVVTPTYGICGSGPTSVQEHNSDNGFAIYPNPAKDKFIVKGIERGSVFVMYDLLGKEILRRSELKETEEISIQTFNEGIYFYKIIREDKIEKTGKLIKE